MSDEERLSSVKTDAGPDAEDLQVLRKRKLVKSSHIKDKLPQYEDESGSKTVRKNL